MTNVTLALPRCCCSFWLPLILPEPEAKKSLVESNNRWSLTQPELGKKPDFAQLTDSVPAFDFPNPSSVLETSFRQASYSTNFECNPSKLLPQLLDQLIALGQTARQLRQTLDNGHHPDKVADLVKQSLEGGGHAP